MKTGIAYGVGVGPGDPELMTLKAVRIIRENTIIAVPAKNPKDAAAYQIAVKNVPELAEKELVPLDLPMVRDKALLQKAHRECAKIIESYLDQGQNVVYITLGDPTVYSTFGYLQYHLQEDGYPVEFVSGVPSFCAAAARLNIPLAEWNEPLHIIPSVHMEENPIYSDGNYVLMKSIGRTNKVKKFLKESGKSAGAVENCGMENEKCFHSIDQIPDEMGYFSLIIAKGGNDSSD